MNIKKFEEYEFWKKLAIELCDIYIAQYDDFETAELHNDGFEVTTKVGGRKYWSFRELSNLYCKKIGWKS
jgi:hypothetical protein